MRSGGTALLAAAAISAQTLFALLVLAGLGRPLLWHDEAETAMFGRRVLEHGYPKVHDARNTVYGVHHAVEIGVYAPLDAYLGSPWGQYYFAAPAVAWSDAAQDLGERTWRVRFPFACAGWLGVLLLGAVGASLWPAGAGGRAVFWLGYGVCLALSVSLQLHLREVRYYPLVALGVGLVAWLEARRHARGDLAAPLHALLLAAVLFGLFNLFYPAFGVISATAVLAAAWALLRGAGPAQRRIAAFARAAAPYALAGVAALPLVVFFRIPAQSRSFLETFSAPANAWTAHLANALSYLLRYELLLPAAVGALFLAWARRRAGPDRARAAAALRACDLVAALIALWVPLVARTPLFFSRYHVALSPLLAAMLVLEAGCLAALARGPARRIALSGVAAIAVAFAAAVALRAPELHGRWTELREPYRGPLDHVIPYLAARHPEPAELVIATNYEESSYMFYLGATTTLGYYAPDRVRDLATPPDVVIPRPWPVNARALGFLLDQHSYAPREFPVANVRANNLPELSPRNQAGLVHRFRSPVVGVDGVALVIGERIPDEPRRVSVRAGGGCCGPAPPVDSSRPRTALALGCVARAGGPPPPDAPAFEDLRACSR